MDLTDPFAEPSPRCLLIYNDPGAPSSPGGAGWLLVTAVGTGRPATVALAAHGAGRHAGPRTAKSVATRVLAEHGHEVAEWHDRSTAPPVFRAVLRPGATAPLPQDPPATGTAEVGAESEVEVEGEGEGEGEDVPVMRVRRLRRFSPP